nr:hypothetical protein [uncultured Ruminococcus sp.]
MKNTNTKRSKVNIIFSSFIIIGYIVCTYFFSSLASQVSGTLGSLIQILILLIFGLLLFYTTRVGEGKQVRRFSLAVLLLIDLPALYIILAALIPALPFHDAIAPQSTMAMMGLGGQNAPSIILMAACVALGYGLPYTFFSGYEMKEEDEEAEDGAVVEGGLAEELAEIESENEEKAEILAQEAEEAVEEAKEEAGETAENTADAAEDAAEEIEEKKEEE